MVKENDNDVTSAVHLWHSKVSCEFWIYLKLDILALLDAVYSSNGSTFFTTSHRKWLKKMIMM